MPHLLSVASIFRSRTEGNSTKDQTTLRSPYPISRLSSHGTGSTTHSNHSNPTITTTAEHEGDESAYTYRPPPMESSDNQPPPPPSITSLRPSLRQRHSHNHGSSLSDDDAPPLPSPTTKKKRHFTFPLPWISKENETPSPATLDFVVESPPVLFHLDPERSSGALVSGQVVLDIKEEKLEVNSILASVVKRVVQKKPFQNHCDDCSTHEEELQKWSFMTHPTILTRGTYKFPFTGILDGHLPITTETGVVCINYELRATTLISRHPVTPGSPGIPLSYSQPLQVRRSLPETDNSHNSVRVFPPTNIRASAQYQQVLYPANRGEVTMSLDGLTTRVAENDSIECWRLKKASWRLEESIKSVTKACTRHASHISDPAELEAETNKNKIPRTETRVLGEEIISRDWKSDYLSADGHLELYFDFGLHPATRKPPPHHAHYYPHYHHHQNNQDIPRFACDTTTPEGVQISHSLLVELIVSRARAPASKPEALVDTGTGRILRMRFRVYLTEKPGSSVAWDDEAPPLYAEVPPSPPCYDGGNPLDQAQDSDGGEHEPIYAERDSVEWREGEASSSTSS